jgi:UDP-N-acetyl-D-mannosaminuronate dehydrogenase
MATFADEGIRAVGYDIDADRVETINDGEIPIDTLEYWLGMDPEPLVS